MQISFTIRIGFGFMLLLAGTMRASSAPWAALGDNQLRADIELLSIADVIDGVTTPWPLPWTSIARDLQNVPSGSLNGTVNSAAARVKDRAERENESEFSAGVILDATNGPGVVHGFDSLGRGDGQGAVWLSYNSSNFAARLSLGGFTQTFHGGDTKLMLDGTYAAVKLWDEAIVYGGWIDHWWGPGWISALSLSNNARPIPQIGIERLNTTASSWPILGWLGPWQLEFFVGLLDGPRLQENTLYHALRFTFNPAPGLEIGLGRTGEMCGQGHGCNPLRDYFDLRNDPGHINNTNDEGMFDIKYSHVVWGVPAQIYMQLMNEDSSPFTHSDTSHLFGVTVFANVGSGSLLRLTVEYASSISTQDIFSFGDHTFGSSYNNFDYPDGMRYRGRTIGFSLDNDSELLSLQGAWTAPNGIFYEVSLHHAAIGTSHFPLNNIVSPIPVRVNMAEARVTFPLRQLKIDLAGRLQDDQPRPKSGFTAAFELGLRLDM